MINSSRSIEGLLRRRAGVVTAILPSGCSMDQPLKSCTLGTLCLLAGGNSRGETRGGHCSAPFLWEVTVMRRLPALLLLLLFPSLAVAQGRQCANYQPNKQPFF